MEVSYLGAGTVALRGRNTNVLVNPYGDDSGLAKLKGNYDVILLGDTDMKNPLPEVMSFDGPGEYEVKGTMISGVPARRRIDAEGLKATMFRVDMDEVRVVIVGNVAPGLSNEQLETLGEVELLVVPVGGHGLTLDATAAAEVVTKLEPNYVVPVHYDDGVTKYPMPQDLEEVFLKEMGATAAEPQGKLKIAGKELPAETAVVVLKRSGS